MEAAQHDSRPGAVGGNADGQPGWTTTFDDPTITLARAGGKALNLGLMTRAGLPVPVGFVVTTDAYRAMLQVDGLEQYITSVLDELGSGEVDPTTLEQVSSEIRKAFTDRPVPSDVARAIAASLDALGVGDGSDARGASPVAVRSSATAEDLPHLSFAGQQDTYLGVVGEQAVLDAVRRCWASLFTARAMHYRHQAGIPDAGTALAVVVQRQVDSAVSGVLFTANPVTGQRAEMVLDATWGLGETLVSGQVVPDHWVADARTGRIREHQRGTKAVTMARAGSGVRTEDTPLDRQARDCLSAAQVEQVVALGRQVEAYYGSPQDIELAVDGDGHIHVVQSRAITSLYPVPEGAGPDEVYFSFAAVQGVSEPLTPLGRDALRLVLGGGATVFGGSGDPDALPYVREAGQRLWIRIDKALEHPVGRALAPRVLSVIDPAAGTALPLAEHVTQRPTLASVRALGRFGARVLPNARRVLAHPERGRALFDVATARLVEAARRREHEASLVSDPLERVRARARSMADTLGSAFPAIVPWAAPHIPAAALSPWLLTRLASGPTPAGGAVGAAGHATRETPALDPRAMQVVLAAPNNPTTEMDLALYEVAAAARRDPASVAALTNEPAAQLSLRYLGLADPPLPEPMQRALQRFLDSYGSRGTGEIDLGRVRWREDPTPVLRVVQAALAHGEDSSPPTVFARGQRQAADAVHALRVQARFQPGGWVRERLVEAVARRARALTGGREQPKWTVIQLMGVVREGLLASGADLVALGALDRAEDIMLLRRAELAGLTRDDLDGLRQLIEPRRAAMAREARRAKVPRLLFGDGRAVYEGMGAAPEGDGGIVGSGVSPGVVEGLTRVVTDPAHSELQTGEILVCVGTDPAWTPLFMTAAGLVTEVGGMMTHGSVVAREYGIPAVVGVHEATTRLATGTRVRLDGAAGSITPLEDEHRVRSRTP